MRLMNKIFNQANISRDKYVKAPRQDADGLACVASIFSVRNIQMSFEELEIKYSDFLSDFRLNHIIRIFQDYNVKTRALQCSSDELINLSLPCIIYWDMKQFVVLTGLNKGKFEIFNPFSKREWFTKDEFEQHYAEIALQIIE